MYTVVEFKLPKDLNVVIKETVDYSINTILLDPNGQHAGPSHNRAFIIDVPESGGKEIYLMKYLVGERIVFRRSLTGMKIIRGLPDYSGKVKRNNLTDTIPRMVTELQKSYKSAHSQSFFRGDRIRASNLCQEIDLPMFEYQGTNRGPRMGAYPDLATFSDFMTQPRTRDIDRAVDRLAAEEDRRIVAELHAQSMAQHMADLESYLRARPNSPYYYTARNVGRSMPSHRFFSSDFDGDMRYSSMGYSVAPQAEAQGPAPRYVDNTYQVTEVDLSSAIRATAEITQGERGRPPASRGPRPRNQRW